MWVCQKHQQAATSHDHESHFGFGGRDMHREPDSDSVLWYGYHIESFKKGAEMWLVKDPAHRCSSSKEQIESAVCSH